MLPAFAQAAGAAAALSVVLLLIVLAARGARLLPLAGANRASGVVRLHGTLALDTKRRLHLIEADGRQALVLTGGGQDVLLAWQRAAEHSIQGAP